MVARAWPSESVIPRCVQAKHDLDSALLAEIGRRTAGLTLPDDITDNDAAALVRATAGPMVRGLFRPEEQEPVLAAVVAGAVFLTPATIRRAIVMGRQPRTGWTVANIYLNSVGAEPFSAEFSGLVGLSDGTSCYVTAEYLNARDHFSDFLVHEVAHMFHNCHRHQLGLVQTVDTKYPLPIDYRRHETFAYSCEFFSCITARATLPADRLALVAVLEASWRADEERVDIGLVVDILRQAVVAPDGWQVVLQRCRAPEEPPPPKRRRKPARQLA